MVGEVENLISELYDELAPIIEMIDKYELWYKNSATEGRSRHGIIVGKTKEEPYRLFVLKSGNVYTANDSGELNYHEASTLGEFLRLADLTTVKSGFEYVKKCRCVDKNPIAERNKALQQFLKENEKR